MDAEDRVGVLVGELDDGSLGRDVHPVQVGEVELADRDGPDGIGAAVGHDLDPAAFWCHRIEPLDHLDRHLVADRHAKRSEDRLAGRVGVDQVPVGIDPHDRIRVVVRKAVDRADLVDRQTRGTLVRLVRGSGLVAGSHSTTA